VRPLRVTSAAFEHNGKIPPKFTAEGANVSPPLAWGNLPPTTCSLALIAEDLDNPRPEASVNWVIYGIPASVAGLPEGMPGGQTIFDPIPAVQGVNARGVVGYMGPEAGKARGEKRVHFRLFALDRRPDLAPGASRDELMAAIKRHVIGTGEVVGVYAT
jgi:Raf kinase inhibitor-like YbhB/YbcL family protein